MNSQDDSFIRTTLLFLLSFPLRSSDAVSVAEIATPRSMNPMRREGGISESVHRNVWKYLEEVKRDLFSAKFYRRNCVQRRIRTSLLIEDITVGNAIGLTRAQSLDTFIPQNSRYCRARFCLGQYSPVRATQLMCLRAVSESVVPLRGYNYGMSSKTFCNSN